VDNGSEGNDAQILETEFGNNIKLIRNDRNYGYTGGNNIGIKYALKEQNIKYILLLNNDTVVDLYFLNEMIKVSEADQFAGVIGGKIYDYGTQRIQSVWGGINMWTGQPSYEPKFIEDEIKNNPLDRGQYDQIKVVKRITGCCMLIKREVIESNGLLDESYFAYFEDIEYCIRAKKAGYATMYAPGARVWHKGGRSGDKSSGFAKYLNTRNRLWFMRKYASWQQYACFSVYFFAVYIWVAIAYYAIIDWKLKLVTQFLHGVKDGLTFPHS
jgi:GT2 family glycosyltransferase